jgi:hypothetical protein
LKIFSGALPQTLANKGKRRRGRAWGEKGRRGEGREGRGEEGQGQVEVNPHQKFLDPALRTSTHVKSVVL